MKTTFLLFAVFANISLFSQNISLELIPENPSITDEIFIVATTVWPSGGCDQSSITMDVSMLPEILIEAEHPLGFLSVICTSVDTFSIGMLPASAETSPGVFEPYMLVYNAEDTFEQSPYVTIDTIYFVVSDISTNLSKLKVPEGGIVFPNPTHHSIQIKGDYSGVPYVIYDTFGQIVFKGINDNSQIIQLQELNAGVYFFQLEGMKTQRILKQD